MNSNNEQVVKNIFPGTIKNIPYNIDTIIAKKAHFIYSFQDELLYHDDSLFPDHELQ